MLPDIAFDLESPYSKEFSVVDLGYWKYARDPQCVPYLVSVCDGAESWAGEPHEFNWDSLKGRRLVSHNRPFDCELSIAAMERGLWAIPDLKPYGNDFWECSLDMSAYCLGVRSLADACRIGLGVTVDKGVRDRAKGKTADDMKKEGWWPEMQKYGRQDAANCWNLWNTHQHKWPEFERRLSRLTMEQGRYGIRIDVAALDTGIALLQKVIFAAQQNLPWTQRGRAPASPIGIAEECRLVGIPSPPVKAHDPEAAQDWEDAYAPKHKFVLALRNLRKAKKTLATLETIKLRLRDDETIATSLKYFGAVPTGRWAGDSGLNLQNFSREPLFVDPSFSFILNKNETQRLSEAFDHGEPLKMSDGSQITALDVRGLIIARPGMKLCPVDLAQIEPRVLNFAAGNETFLQFVREGKSVYEAHARTYADIGWKGGDLKKENKKLYQECKIRELMLGYQAGYEKLIAFAALNGVDLTIEDEAFALRAAVDGKIHTRTKIDGKWTYTSEVAEKFGVESEDDHTLGVRTIFEQCIFVPAKRKGVECTKAVPVYGMQARTIVSSYRGANVLLVALWTKFGDVLRASVGEDLTVELPSGRKMVYRKIRQESRTVVDKDSGVKVERKVFTAEIGARRFVIYSGHLVENFCQATARDVFAENQLAIHEKLQAEDPRQRVLFTVHDEAVPEIVDPGADPEAQKVAAKRLEDMMSAVPSWLAGCPLGAEAHVLSKYGK